MRLLLPIVLGIGLGFLGISRILAFFLNTYPDQSVCLFAGLIFGMLPSLFREAGEKGRSRGSFVSLGVAFAAVLTQAQNRIRQANDELDKLIGVRTRQMQRRLKQVQQLEDSAVPALTAFSDTADEEV